MSVTLWDTNGGEVVAALAAERRAGGPVTAGLALTLVVLAAEREVAAAEQAATVAAAAHPCRLLLVVRRQLDTADRLDAEVQVGGRLGPIEAVVMRMYGRLGLHAESVVLPLLAADAPVLTWWHGPPPTQIATEALGVLADRRVTDSALAADPLAALAERAVDYAPGDTDLAWSRATGWRSLLASAFDATLEPPVEAVVQAAAGNPSAALLAGWLGARLGVPATVVESAGPGVTAVRIRLADGELAVHRPDGRLATFSRTGQADRELPLPRRDLGELMAEELRRLDPDPVYAEALATATGVAPEQLANRPRRRAFVWRDPALAGG
jgi:glucose-6-phosphate dehydrogenase assembly protein OpcA